jgi:tRNA (guanine-N7-)-methyltransferase
VRKPLRLTFEELTPYQWQMPRFRKTEASGKKEEDGEEKNTTNGTEDFCETHDQTDYEPHKSEPLNWRRLFGNDNAVEIEVGMGKGLFLLTSALARPDTNFFGIEIVRKYQLYATTRFALRRLSNVKTVCADARWVLRQFVPPGSVTAIHVYFPDPWWKARHKKRRVFTPGFAEDVAMAIAAGGRFHIASDVEEYFGVMTGIVRTMPAFRELRTETSTAPLETAGYQTNFERKARQKGTPIWRADYERTNEPFTS